MTMLFDDIVASRAEIFDCKPFEIPTDMQIIWNDRERNDGQSLSRKYLAEDESKKKNNGEETTTAFRKEEELTIDNCTETSRKKTRLLMKELSSNLQNINEAFTKFIVPFKERSSKLHEKRQQHTKAQERKAHNTMGLRVQEVYQNTMKLEQMLQEIAVTHEVWALLSSKQTKSAVTKLQVALQRQREQLLTA
eukprot:g508.t1